MKWILTRFQWISPPIVRGLVLLGLIGLNACQPPDPPNVSPTNTPKIEDNSRLTLNNATLEQANPSGQTLWKVQVKKATYSQDQKIGYLETVKGNIYQDGKIVLQVSADRGEVYKDGQEILLKENIIAIDPRNQAVIRSREVRWQPKNGILIVREDLRGNHAKLDATATEGKYDTRHQRLELIGNVIAIAKEPQVRLKTERLLWEIPREIMNTDQPVAFDRYKDTTIIDRVTAKGGRWEMKNFLVTLRENIEYRSLEPPLQIAGSQFAWKYKERVLSSEQPTEIFQSVENVSITGNRAIVELGKRIAYLQNGVKGINRKTGAKLYSQTLTWKIDEKIVEAQGNVIYEQLEPKFNVTGDRAIGMLEDDNIVVSSSSADRVVTEIYPR